MPSIEDYTLGAHRHTKATASTLDDFPTPPWAVRAMMDHCLLTLPNVDISSVWDPTGNRGYMAATLAEYFLTVHATDIKNYNGFGQGTADFLNPDDVKFNPAWIIANPPFAFWDDFVLEAFKHARQGVAMFGRTQVLAGQRRYERIFRDNPPTVIAHHVNRVRCVKGRYDPEGSTRTDYSWFIWIDGMKPLPSTWIPGHKKDFIRDFDAELPEKMEALGRIEKRPRFWRTTCHDQPLLPQ